MSSNTVTVTLYFPDSLRLLFVLLPDLRARGVDLPLPDLLEFLDDVSDISDFCDATDVPRDLDRDFESFRAFDFEPFLGLFDFGVVDLGLFRSFDLFRGGNTSSTLPGDPGPDETEGENSTIESMISSFSAKKMGRGESPGVPSLGEGTGDLVDNPGNPLVVLCLLFPSRFFV